MPRSPAESRRTERALNNLGSGSSSGGSSSSTSSTGWRVVEAPNYTAALPRLSILGVSFTKTIDTVTDATPNVVTTTANHGLITGQLVVITGCSESVVNATWVITRISDTTFSLDGSTNSLAAAGTGGTVQHEMVVTVDVSTLQRPSHGLRSLTHLTISDVAGATQANGTFSIDSGTHDIYDVRDNGSGGIRIELFFSHGYSDGETIRVESVEKGAADESEGTWTINVVSATVFDLDTNVLTGLPSAFVTTYEGRGGLCSRAETFRLIEDDKAWNGRRAYVAGDIVVVRLIRYTCATAHTNQKPPNATYWTVTAPSTYTSGGTLIIPGEITILSSTGLTPLSSGTQRQAAVAEADDRGWGLGLPIRLTTATQTVYGVIVGVPGEEGFPYTDPTPLPFYLDNQLKYAGPQLYGDLTQVAVGRPEMVHHDRMICNTLPFYGSECELPITPLSYDAPTKFRTTGGGNTYGTYGKAFFRWDGAVARVVAFALQHDTAGVYGDWGTFSGGNVAIVPDARRPGVWSGGIPIDTVAWVTTQPYFVGEMVLRTAVLYLCTQAHNVDGVGDSQDPATTNSDDGTNFWRSLHTSTLTWSGATAYVRGDIVTDGGSLYLCTLAHTNQQPTSGSNVPDYWREAEVTIAPPTWTAGTYGTGNVLTKNNVGYIATASTSAEPPGTGWTLSARETYEDGSVNSGSRVTRNLNANFSPGNPSTGLIGWEFVSGGIKTYVRDRVRFPTKLIDVPGAATASNFVTTTTSHELRNGQVVTISGCDDPDIDGDWEIIRDTNTTFYLIDGPTGLTSAWTGGEITGYSFRSFITEDGELEETTSATYKLSDFPLQPKINLDVGGQMLSTHANSTGIRTNRDDNLATWNPPNEINPESYDIVYNSRAGIASTGVGNQPGLRAAGENDLLTYTEGTVSIQYGVVTLSEGYFPAWALQGEIILEGDTAVLTVKEADDWDTDIDYLIGQLVIDDVAAVDHVFIAIGTSTSADAKPETNTADWQDLGPAIPTVAAPIGGYTTHLQLSNVTFNALPGSRYTLRPEGDATKWLTMFLTIVTV